MLAYALTILLSSFLLFEVQPMIAKIILPWFGGTAAVWTACLLFFQLALLGGYLYAHASIRLLRPRGQGILHLVLLGASLLVLPVMPGAGWRSAGEGDPTLRIMALLACSVGLPYFMLSTTGPLLQAWYARTHVGSVPYRLFALSNLGSLMALITYPIWIEPSLATGHQASTWSLAYAGFVLACAYVARNSCFCAQPPTLQDASAQPPTPQDASAQLAPSAGRWEAEAGCPRPGVALHLLWMICAAVPSVLLLAVTTHLTENVAPIPFLWVLPLTVYLVSFILCFEGRWWYWRPLFLLLLPASLGGCAWALAEDNLNTTLTLIVPLFVVMLFAACMTCHGELSRLKPHPRFLTGFYLMLSVGGAVGGVFVALVAPRVFTGAYELHLGMVACLLVVTAALALESRTRTGWRALLRVAGAGVFLLAAAALGLVLYQEAVQGAATRIAMVRNFYGCLSVSQDGAAEATERILLHGTIRHGTQFVYSKRRRWPTTYYSRLSGVGLAIENCHRDRPQRVGAVGLGCGTLACYTRKGDSLRIYEINPLVQDLAAQWFSYLTDCRGQVDVVLGDARSALERQEPNDFDVLVVDAFSGDAIPVHLLTREAFAVYFRHLKPTGVLAVHVSNRYLNLEPVVKAAADHFGKQAAQVSSSQEDDIGATFASWILVSGDGAFFKSPEVSPFTNEIDCSSPSSDHAASPLASNASLRPWTDDYSNLYQVLETDTLSEAWQKFWESFRHGDWTRRQASH